MPRRNYTDITVVLDRSGSMSAIREGTISGMNKFIDDQKDVPGDGCWSLILFDDQYEVVYSHRPQSQVPKFTEETFVPRGNTALIDAVCRTIDDTGARLAAMPEEDRPDKVLMVIMTDGLENMSNIYARQYIKAHPDYKGSKPGTMAMAERIAHQRNEYKWAFAFLGANQDAIAEATSYGMSAVGATNYKHTNAGAHEVLCCSGAASRAWKAEGTGAEFIIDPADELPPVQVNVNVNT